MRLPLPLPLTPAMTLALAVSLVAPLAACTFGVGEGEGEGEAGEGEAGEGEAGEGEAGEGEAGEGEAGEGEGDAGGEGEGDVAGVDPPFGDSSHGAGGAQQSGTLTTASGVEYRVVMPASPTTPTPLLVAYSGVEGGAQMASNLQQAGPPFGLDDVMFAVIDGAVFFGDGGAGADVLDDVRAHYDVDNDRTYLLSESAGTSAGLELGFTLRQSYFAAYWVNDVNADAAPALTASQLGFAPFGNAGPGGDFTDANSIVASMRAAGYRVEDPAPYDGAGAGTHGDTNQFIAAIQWFVGRSRR